MSKTVRPFADFLAELNAGRTHHELSEALNDLITAVNSEGKAGTVTLTIKVGPAETAEDMVAITDDVKVKLPVGARPKSMWWVTPDGNATRHNPAQERLPLREVPTIPDDAHQGKEKHA